MDKTNASARTALVSFSLVALALGTWLAFSLARSITVPLRGAAGVADSIARFDLSQTVSAGGGDETGMLLGSIDAMQGKLLGLIGEVRGSAENIGTASAEIAVGNHDLSARTEQTASNLQEVAASMSQLTGAVRQTADSALTANQLSSSATETATRGGAVMGEVVSTMVQITESSRRIAEIITTIDGIALRIHRHLLEVNKTRPVANTSDLP